MQLGSYINQEDNMNEGEGKAKGTKGDAKKQRWTSGGPSQRKNRKLILPESFSSVINSIEEDITTSSRGP